MHEAKLSSQCAESADRRGPALAQLLLASKLRRRRRPNVACCDSIYKEGLEQLGPLRSDSFDVDLFPMGTNNEVVFALLETGRLIRQDRKWFPTSRGRDEA